MTLLDKLLAWGQVNLFILVVMLICLATERLRDEWLYLRFRWSAERARRRAESHQRAADALIREVTGAK